MSDHYYPPYPCCGNLVFHSSGCKESTSLYREISEYNLTRPFNPLDKIKGDVIDLRSEVEKDMDMETSEFDKLEEIPTLMIENGIVTSSGSQTVVTWEVDGRTYMAIGHNLREALRAANQLEEERLLPIF